MHFMQQVLHFLRLDAQTDYKVPSIFGDCFTGAVSRKRLHQRICIVLKGLGFSPAGENWQSAALAAEGMNGNGWASG
jgi:hypothetical protein